MSKGTFVIIKAANCGVCTGRLEPMMPMLHKRFKSEGYDVVEYKIDRMRENVDRNGKPVYPESLGLIWWYPFMFFVDNRTWGEIKTGQDRRNKIKIVNGSFSEGAYKLEEESPINFLDPNILMGWLNEISLEQPITPQLKVKSPLRGPEKEPKDVQIDSNPFLMSNKKKNILEINYCNIKIVPKRGRS